ncbi:MAG: hypothetical protein WAP35_09545, partial [Solirubrobacterales bacterium]
SFGGKTAKGTTIWRQDYCPKSAKCPDDGKKLRIVASKADYCAVSGQFEYQRIKTYAGKKLWTIHKLACK